MKKTLFLLSFVLFLPVSKVMSDKPAGKPKGTIPKADVPVAALGNKEAPLHIIEFSSLTCLHCAEFHKKTLPIIRERFINKGSLYFKFQPFPLDGASLVGAVTFLKSKNPYKVMHAFFDDQEKWMDMKDIKTYFLNISGVKRADLDKALSSSFTEKLVQARNQAIETYKIKATPTFVIYHSKSEKVLAVIEGALDATTFSKKIDALLKTHLLA